jgi:tetratricopeptide (TPR) repeat protein
MMCLFLQKRTRVCYAVFMAGVLLAGNAVGGRQDVETYLDPEVRKRMDTFEEESLGRADRLYGSGDYRGAFAEYEAFVLDYPKSDAIPYALMRKGRTRQMVEKRYEAIKLYREVLDYFPNHVRYAAASLYYTGLCHQQNGNMVEALKAYKEMAEDKDYRQHFLAADAIYELACNLDRQQRYEDAVKYYQQVAVDFRTRLPDTAYQALQAAVLHYVQRVPTEGELRKFYAETRGFGGTPLRPTDVPPLEKMPEDYGYWSTLQSYVGQLGGRFGEKQEAEREAYYRYWAELMDNRFMGHDGFRLNVFRYMTRYKHKGKTYIDNVDTQFRRDAATAGRVHWFIENCWGTDYPAKVEEYYALYPFDSASNQQLISFARMLWDRCQAGGMALSAAQRVKWKEFNDAALCNYASDFYRRSGDLARHILSLVKDRDLADYTLLGIYFQYGNYDEGIPLARKVQKVPEYAGQASWWLAQMLFRTEQYQECIAVCQALQQGAGAYYMIADCYVKLKNIGAAVQQLREIETFFKDQSSRACLKIADVYRGAGKRAQQVAVLREVMRKYPDTGESSNAHNQLEALGEMIGGGVDAKED